MRFTGLLRNAAFILLVSASLPVPAVTVPGFQPKPVAPKPVAAQPVAAKPVPPKVVAVKPVAPQPVVDADHDGVPDSRDACIFDFHVPVTANGCPDLSRISLAGLKFRPEMRGVLSESFWMLNPVVASLKANPSLYVQVMGYAEGPASASLRLWQRRAESVFDYLVANGVDPSQLDAKGYGAHRDYSGRIALRVL